MTSREAAEHVLGIRIAKAEYGDLTTPADDVTRGVGYDVQALLVHQSRDHAEQRAIGVLQTQPGAHQLGIRLLAGQVVRLEVVRQMRVAAWVPAFVDPIDNAGQPALNGNPACKAMEASAESLGGDLARIGRTDRRYVVGIEQTGLEERHAVVKFDAVYLERTVGDAECAHALTVAQALVCNVVDGEHGRHARALPAQYPGARPPGQSFTCSRSGCQFMPARPAAMSAAASDRRANRISLSGQSWPSGPA